MRLGITGASGFLGGCLVRLARGAGHEVVPFSRYPRSPASRRFSTGEPPDLSGLDGVVHLAGESLMGLWTPAKKRRMVASRVEGTRRVVEAIGRLPDPKPVLVCASAVGFYGDTGDRETDETAAGGRGFLAAVCRAWEDEAARAEACGARAVRLRLGMVLGRGGGALRLMVPVFRLGLGGPLGGGAPWMACIHVEDAARLILWACESPDIGGPVNAVMPQPVRNADFVRALARAVRRPAVLPVPAVLLRLLPGRMGAMFLDSQRVVPAVALRAGFSWRYPTPAEALAEAVGRSA